MVVWDIWHWTIHWTWWSWISLRPGEWVLQRGIGKVNYRSQKSTFAKLVPGGCGISHQYCFLRSQSRILVDWQYQMEAVARNWDVPHDRPGFDSLTKWAMNSLDSINCISIDSKVLKGTGFPTNIMYISSVILTFFTYLNPFENPIVGLPHLR